MATITAIDPVTRLEGHLKIEVTIDTVDGVQQVTDARATGTLFRGFENILINRNPDEAQHITERVCGVCPVSHSMAAVLALDSACGVTIPDNARIMRNLVLGANFLQSHILHFYHLTLPDFITGPDMPPWTPSWQTDRRLNAAASAPLVTNYLKALDMRRKAHEMAALFGGKMPHPPTFVPGGITTSAQATRITKYLAYLDELIPFITDVYLKDVQQLGEVYPEYSKYGGGVGNLLAFGVFLQDNAGATFLKRGRIVKGNKEVQAVDVDAIAEHVTYSWYDDKTNKLAPASGETLAQSPKEKAYSWLKAPRYQDLPYEAGPLARMVVNGDYTGGISVYDRHLARAQEALKVANELKVWAKQVRAGGPERVRRVTLPTTGTVSGLTEAPRGALGHWVQYTGGKISRYQIITPTCWNASPRDSNGVRGPIEEALIGTPVQNTDEPIEVVRVIHSFDPCLACAVHVMRPGKEAKIVSIPHFHSEEEEHRHGH